MHNFNYIGQLPWISDSTINHLNIKYDFIDYESIYKIINKKTITKYKNIGNFKIQASKLNIVIIQENQTNPESLLKFVKSVKNNINKIYIKLRPDRDDAENFLEFLKRFDLRFEQINDLFSAKTKNFIFLGTSSTLLLDLALSNRIAISYSINKIRYFEYPSRNFVNLISKTQRNKSKNKIIENPIYISNKKDFYELINSESLILPSNSAKNHLMFKNHKIQSFLKFCQS